jgi:hypothetical protein
MGPARSTPDLVLSVPDPDISLHFLIRCLKIREQVPKNLIRHPGAGRISIACPVAFLKQNNRVSEALSFSVKTSRSRCKAVACAHPARFRAKARLGRDPGWAPVRVKKTR